MFRSLIFQLTRHPQVSVRYIRGSGSKIRQPVSQAADDIDADTDANEERNEADRRQIQRERLMHQLEKRNPTRRGNIEHDNRQDRQSDHFGTYKEPRRNRERYSNDQGRDRNRDMNQYSNDQGRYRDPHGQRFSNDQDQNRNRDMGEPQFNRWQDQPSRPRGQGFTKNRKEQGQRTDRHKQGYRDEETLTGRPGEVRQMLEQASTFSDLRVDEEAPTGFPEGQGKGQHLPRPDAFKSSPYTRDTRIPNRAFHGGESAMEEAAIQKIDPSLTSVIFFPGQGTQYVGMCGDVKYMPENVRSLYDMASEILGYDLLDLCANGPIEKLNQTVYCQPAVLVSSLAALEQLREKNPHALESCVATAGFSIGEITALIFAGVLSFEDALQLVKVRAEAMQLAAEMTPGALATILFKADAKFNYSLKVARAWCTKEYQIEEPVCSIANYLFPHCKVIGGHREAIEFLEKNHKEFNIARVKRLPVSGAFHTALMKPAADAVALCLKNLEINPSRIPVYANTTGHRYHSSDEVRRQLPKQVCKPVMWEQILHNLYQRPKETEYPTTYECGPGNSLTTVLKMVNAKARLKAEKVEP